MRRKFQLAAVLALATWCTPALAQVEVRMWTLLSGGDGARMRALVDEFNASQNEVQVVSTTLKWGEPFYTKLITASVVGAGPDVATVHLSRIPNLAGGGVLRPISDAELRQAGLVEADFFPRQWAKSRHGGLAYAVPLDIHPLVLYYNKKLLRNTGLLKRDGTLKPLEGGAALTHAFQAVKLRTGRAGLTMESSQSSYAIWRLWTSMLAQRNVPVIQDGRFAYGAAGEEALGLIASWFRQGVATPGMDYAASTAQFMGGNAGFMINGVWEVPELVRAQRQGTLGFNYGIVPLPRIYNNRSVWADSHGFAIPANTGKPASAEKTQAVLRFMAFVSRRSLSWAEGGHLVANRTVAQSSAAQSMQPNAQYATAVQDIMYDPDGWYTGAAGPLQAIASKFLPAALSGHFTPRETLDMFEAEANRLLRKRAPKY